MSISPRGWWSVLLIGACGAAGYALGRAGDPEPRNGERETNVSTSHSTRTVPQGLEDFGELLSEHRPKAEIWKTVSRIPAANIPEALKMLREARDQSPDEIESDRLDDVASALYFHWAESYPQAALADVLSHPEYRGRTQLVESVLAAWMNTDPDAAYAAVKDHKDYEFQGRTMLVRTWNPDNVFENLERHPDHHRILLGWYCIAAVENESQRNATLAALRDRSALKDRAWAGQLFFRAWGYQDFGEAFTAARTLGVPWLETQLLRDNFRNDPGLAMPWAANHDITPGGPIWEEGYARWLREIDPKKARDWFVGVSSEWLAQGHFAAVAGLLARDLDLSETAKDTINRDNAAQQLAQVMETWKTKDPAAAGKWLSTAPMPARELLTPKGDHSHE